MWEWRDIWHDVSKHRYVYIGFAAWLLMLPLALTSNQRMIRKLRQNWKRLHRLIYLIAIFAVLHFFWLTKKDFSEPTIYALIVACLLSMRSSMAKKVVLLFKQIIARH